MQQGQLLVDDEILDLYGVKGSLLCDELPPIYEDYTRNDSARYYYIGASGGRHYVEDHNIFIHNSEYYMVLNKEWINLASVEKLEVKS